MVLLQCIQSQSECTWDLDLLEYLKHVLLGANIFGCCGECDWPAVRRDEVSCSSDKMPAGVKIEHCDL